MDWFLYDRDLHHEEFNQHAFYQFEKQEGNDEFSKSTLTISGKY